MNASNTPGRLTRRSLLLGGAGAATIIAVGHNAGGKQAAPSAQPLTVGNVQLAADSTVPPDVHLAATDGWVNIARPGNAADTWMKDIAPFWPDTTLVPDAIRTDANLYVFGFRNVTGLDDSQVIAQRGRAQISAPQLGFRQIDKTLSPAEQGGYRVKLSNLGLQIRPDLVDGHTIHWHGFVNAIPMFDGVPELSFSVPIGRSFTYFYRPYDPGTYMYHCHFEDVEHVQMGMTGLIFVTPLQDGQLSVDFLVPDVGNTVAVPKMKSLPLTKFVFNDGDGSTGYHRQFGLFQTEIFAEGHYRDAHIQTTDWTTFRASFWALNGRTYPDTVAPSAPVDASTHNGYSRGHDPLLALQGSDTTLAYQPQSALVTCNEGERVLLRIANLGYQSHAMTMDGIDMTIVGKDAWQLKSPATGAAQYITTNTVDVNSGESRDVLFTAPVFDSASAITGAGGLQYNSYLLYDRNYAYASNAGRPGMTGGMVTQVLVFPSGTLGDQGTDANKDCLPDGFAVETIA